MSRKTWLAFCLALSVFVGAGLARAGGDREAAKEAYTEGLRLFAASHEKEAVKAFGDALRLDSSFPDPFRALATISGSRGDIAAMCLEFSAYVMLRSGSHDALKVRSEMAKHAHPYCALGGYGGAADGGSPAPGTLDPAAARAVVKSAYAAVRKCAPAGTGIVVALLKVGTDGRVALVDLRGAPAGKPSGKCIEKKLRALRFKAHEIESEPVPAVFVL